jgi:4-diphosphocytidyl-2-C-methyl-D-erythritol kinase
LARGLGAPRRAAAKVNLWLDVLGRRDDGYHEIETLFVEIPWGDDLRLAHHGPPAVGAPRIELTLAGTEPAPQGEANLAWRAARAFLDAAARDGVAPLPGVVRVHLAKRVPAGSGLGGGSSDAACVLRLLAEALPGRLARETLGRLAAALGADVPFFLEGGTAIGRGRGDVLEPLGPLRPPPLVLVLPPFGCSTAAVFGAWRPGTPAPPGGLAEAVAALRAGDAARLRAACHNGLFFAAQAVHPRLRVFAQEVERRLGRAPAMSGSGSALFDVLEAGEAPAVLGRLEDLPGRRVLVAGAEGTRRGEAADA